MVKGLVLNFLLKLSVFILKIFHLIYFSVIYLFIFFFGLCIIISISINNIGFLHVLH